MIWLSVYGFDQPDCIIVLKNVTQPFRRNPESLARKADSETLVRVFSSLGVDMHTSTSAFSCTTLLVISSTNEELFLP